MKSIKIPFNYDGGKTNYTESISTIAEQKIIDVLTTGRFERVFNHRYGAGIRRFLFEPIDSLSLSDFVTEAKQDALENISRVEILDIKIIQPDRVVAYGNSETTVGVSVTYRLPLGSPQLVTFKVAVPGYITEDTTI